MKPETKLAHIFNDIAADGKQMDSRAAQILALVKDARVRDVEAFDSLVTAAYKANGWNQRVGRPALGDEPKGAVPATVRTYVSLIRRAFRAGVRVSAMPTFRQLKLALARTLGKHRRRVNGRAVRAIPKRLREDFIGVNLDAANDMNGSLMHDLGAVYVHLPTDQRDLFERQLTKLLRKYLPLAEGIKPLPAALPAPKKEVA